MRTVPVGTKGGASPYGALDLAGNAHEWVLDWYYDGYYATLIDAHDPIGSVGGSYRVLRGGSWSNAPTNLHSAQRYRYPPDLRSNYVGFRCAIAIPASE